jgi:hypothetical protein
MSYITYNNNIVEPIQTHNSIAKVRTNRDQESIEIDQKQEFTEIEKDLGFFKGIFIGVLFAIPLWFLIVRLIVWLI